MSADPRLRARGVVVDDAIAFALRPSVKFPARVALVALAAGRRSMGASPAASHLEPSTEDPAAGGARSGSAVPRMPLTVP